MSMARPKIELDAELVRQLARAQLTTLEIARICECSPDTIERRFAATLKEWKDEGVGSVRRRLFQSALGEIEGANQTTAMIFFLKNYGGMSDRQEQTIKHEYADLSGLSADELDAVAKLVESAATGKTRH